MAGFVLGALEKREQQELLSHIRSCVPCLLLAEEHMEVGAKLAASIPEAEAPISLRIRTLATFAQGPVDRMRHVANVPGQHRPGLGRPRVSRTIPRRAWRWILK